MFYHYVEEELQQYIQACKQQIFVGFQILEFRKMTSVDLFLKTQDLEGALEIVKRHLSLLI